MQENVNKNNDFVYPKLDYSIEDMQERNKIVYEIIETVPKNKLTPYYLEILTRYLTIDPKNKKTKKVLTDNRLITVNKREISFQGLVSKLQAGEDGIYNFMTGGDKNIFLVPKIKITQKDIQTIPGLKNVIAEIKRLEEQRKKARGKKKFLLTKQLIEMRRQQYVLKGIFKPPVSVTKIFRSNHNIQLDEKITVNKQGEPISDCLISFFNPQHIKHLLGNYSEIKADIWGKFKSDLYYLMEDFDELVDRTLKEQYPILYDIVIFKIDGLTNKEIMNELLEKYGVTYTTQYLSRVWRKKIPNLIAEAAKRQWIVWHYTFEEKGQWKRCSQCHQIKLAHPYFFTKNRTSKDGYYSVCKKCRNKKVKVGQKKQRFFII